MLMWKLTMQQFGGNPILYRWRSLISETCRKCKSRVMITDVNRHVTSPAGSRGHAGCKEWRGRRQGQWLIRALKQWAGQRVGWDHQHAPVYCKETTIEVSSTPISLTSDPWQIDWLVSLDHECLTKYWCCCFFIYAAEPHCCDSTILSAKYYLCPLTIACIIHFIV